LGGIFLRTLWHSVRIGSKTKPEEANVKQLYMFKFRKGQPHFLRVNYPRPYAFTKSMLSLENRVPSYCLRILRFEQPGVCIFAVRVILQKSYNFSTVVPQWSRETSSHNALL